MRGEGGRGKREGKGRQGGGGIRKRRMKKRREEERKGRIVSHTLASIVQ